jgi:hypothetical protein
VDPFALVRLVQREPNSYRLEDGMRLRVSAKLEDLNARFAAVQRIIEALSHAADRPRAAASA